MSSQQEKYFILNGSFGSPSLQAHHTRPHAARGRPLSGYFGRSGRSPPVESTIPDLAWKAQAQSRIFSKGLR